MNTTEQIEYEKYLDELPRVERRRELKGMGKALQYSRSAKVRERDEERRLAKILRRLEVKNANS